MNSSLKNQIFTYSAICVIPSSIIAICNYYPVFLTEDSILYLHATSAQVVSALVALSLVSYSFLNTELNQKQERDPTLEEAISRTKNYAFIDLTLTLFIGVFSVGSSLLVISSFKYPAFQDFFMSMSFSSLVLFAYALLKFIHRSFLPESVQKNNEEVFEDSKNNLNDLISEIPSHTSQKKNISKHVPATSQTVNTTGSDSNVFGEIKSTTPHTTLQSSLGEFFIKFSEFENQIRDFHSKYTGTPSSKMSLAKIINQLINLQLIPDPYTKELIYLIRIRNSLAHSSHNTTLDSKDIQNWVKFITDMQAKIFNKHEN